MHQHPNVIKKKKEKQPNKKKTPLHFLCVFKMQIRNLWTRVFCEVGYVGALQQPILRTGLKDQSQN